MDMANRPAERPHAQGAAPVSLPPDADASAPLSAARLHPAVQRWIAAHRDEGHRCADLDPLGVADSADAKDLLAPARFGLAAADELGPGAPAFLGACDVATLDRQL
ncbi:MAG TPA: hypothetical protein VIN03_22140, partial [Roseateles sp.]